MRLGLACLLLLPAALATAGSSDFSSIYFAPESRASFKTVAPGGEVRRFNHDDPASPGRVLSDDGWSATFGDGGQVVVRSPDWKRGGFVWEFDRGRIVGYASGGEKKSIPYDAARLAPDGVLTPLAFFEFTDEYRKEVEESALDGKWEGSGRLCFPFANPNHSGTLFCQLALVALALAALFRGWFRAAAGAASAVLFACMLFTGSRGAMLGFAAGLVPMVVFRCRSMLRSRGFWIAAVAAVVAVAAWFGVLRSDMLTRGFSDGGLDWGNAVRVDMLRTAPAMMVDAPGGWGFVGAGRAYFDWYQPLNGMCMTGSLMNDHLTVMANAGWVGRFVYLFAICLVLVLSWSLARRRGWHIPAAVLTASALMACFNPMMERKVLLVVSLIAAAVVVAHAVWEHGMRQAVLSAASLALAAVMTLAVFWIGDAMRGEGVSVAATGRQVRVGGMRPDVWIVDDSQGAIGGIFACRDIREFYGAVPHTPGAGYVRSIDDLPAGGIGRLVLAGKAGNEWLLRLSENPDARKNLPKDVVFVSPPFAPSEIPSALFHFCRVCVVVGEFAARFQSEYAKPPSFVKVVPGMERYILRWMEHVMEM